jgi:hypothetical protein
MASSNTLKFYLDRAEQARVAAEAATLSNVRDRCRRSEAAWTELADRAALAERNRQQQAMMKAAMPSPQE